MLYERSVLKNVSKFTVIRRCSVKRKDVRQNFAKFTEKHIFQSLFFNKVAGWKPETFRSSHWRCSVKQGALKGALFGLRQYLVNESPLKILKNPFYFTLKALFVLKIYFLISILTFWSCKETA